METNFERVETFLEHHGVKGMKWGVRRDEATLNRIAGRKVRASGGTRSERKALNTQAKKDWKSYKSSTSRKDRKLDKRAALEAKANYILESASKEGSLVKLSTPNQHPQLVTGKQFIDHLARGGYMAPLYTDVITKQK